MTTPTSAAIDIEALLGDKEAAHADLERVKKQVYRDRDLRVKLAALAKGWEADRKFHRQLTIARWILNRHAELVAEKDETEPLLALLQAQSLLATGRAGRAREIFQRAEPAEAFTAQLGRAVALQSLGEPEEGLKIVDKLMKSHAGDAATHVARGRCLERAGEYLEARAAYEKALEQDAEDAAALFHLAYWHDLRGEAQRAIELYEQCVALQPTHVNALLNVGVIYEDQGEYERAVDCFQAVVDAFPNHERARLFLKDATASLDMYFDEDQARRADRQNLILSIPVTDFELSVRSRNCLAKMEIKTLGDLVEKSEAELLSYKNFGETSLMEIKEILSKKGLRLGMGKEIGPSKPRTGLTTKLLGPKKNPEADKRVADIDFSVRVRTALRTLELETLADLAAKSSRDLLGCKNFGQTSLEEVRQVLARHSLSLSDEPQP